jgi:hypothetical protein
MTTICVHFLGEGRRSMANSDIVYFSAHADVSNAAEVIAPRRASNSPRPGSHELSRSSPLVSPRSKHDSSRQTSSIEIVIDLEKPVDASTFGLSFIRSKVGATARILHVFVIQTPIVSPCAGFSIICGIKHRCEQRGGVLPHTGWLRNHYY